MQRARCRSFGVRAAARPEGTLGMVKGRSDTAKEMIKDLEEMRMIWEGHSLFSTFVILEIKLHGKEIRFMKFINFPGQNVTPLRILSFYLEAALKIFPFLINLSQNFLPFKNLQLVTAVNMHTNNQLNISSVQPG